MSEFPTVLMIEYNWKMTYRLTCNPYVSTCNYTPTSI